MYELKPASVKFFMPAAQDDAQAEQVYRGLVEGIAKEERPLTNRRIFRIEFVHDGQKLIAEVGKTLDGNLVIAILETKDSTLFYAIRYRAPRFLIGTHAVRSLTLFED